MAARLFAVISLLLFVGCTPLEPIIVPEPVIPTDPIFRIGLGVDRATVQISSSVGLRLSEVEGGILTVLLPGAVVKAEIIDGKLTATENHFGSVRGTVFRLEPADTNGLVAVDGREYHGMIELRVGDRGVTVVNRVSIEQYLVGVVSAEMGSRSPDELAAVQAQAVAARTYALRNRGRWAQQGFDLVADVNDQVYAGVGAENAQAAAAVSQTRGEVLMFEGELVDAFFFSTCSGRTEAGTAAFAGASRPYLRGVDDRDESGTPYCIISPRYTWQETWTAAALRSVLGRTMAANGLPSARSNDLNDLRVVDRSGTNRVATLELSGAGGRTVVTGQAIRRVLAPSAGGILRSNDFTIKLGKTGGRLMRIDLSGRGNGHGVGMCQWGAIGRARAGQDYQTILTSYFPGVQITRMYQ